jgi:hypothetical protein
MSRRALGPTQCPMQMVLFIFFPNVRRLGCEVEHLLRLKISEEVIIILLYAFMARADVTIPLLLKNTA